MPIPARSIPLRSSTREQESPASCKIGPYCVIGPDVELGEDCRLVSHVAIEGPTKIGSDNAILSLLRHRHGATGRYL